MTTSTSTSDNTLLGDDTGGAVDAIRSCPHVKQSLRIPKTEAEIAAFPDLSAGTTCSVTNCEQTENWLCLYCHQVFCGRYANQHMIQHKDEYNTATNTDTDMDTSTDTAAAPASASAGATADAASAATEEVTEPATKPTAEATEDTGATEATEATEATDATETADVIPDKGNDVPHCIALGLGDLSFWCYQCEDYLNHLRIRKVFKCYQIVHKAKFNEEIPPGLLGDTRFPPLTADDNDDSDIEITDVPAAAAVAGGHSNDNGKENKKAKENNNNNTNKMDTEEQEDQQQTQMDIETQWIDAQQEPDISAFMAALDVQQLMVAGHSIYNDRGSLSKYSLFHRISNASKQELIRMACQRNPMIDRCVGSLYGMGIGDATGAPLEFIDVFENDASKFSLKTHKYKKPFNTFGLKRGQWTDDASMGLCMADSLIVHQAYNGSDIRVRFWNWWNRGYNNAFGNDDEKEMPSSVGLGGNISKSIYSMKSQEMPSARYIVHHNRDDSGNGSLMRLAPIPVFFVNHEMEHALRYAKECSFTTHPGFIASEACALMSFVIISAIRRNCTPFSSSASSAVAGAADIEMKSESEPNNNSNENENNNGNGNADADANTNATANSKPAGNALQNKLNKMINVFSPAFNHNKNKNKTEVQLFLETLTAQYLARIQSERLDVVQRIQTFETTDAEYLRLKARMDADDDETQELAQAVTKAEYYAWSQKKDELIKLQRERYAKDLMIQLLKGEEKDKSLERCWNWKNKFGDLGLHLTMHNRGSSYNGYPNTGGYFGSYCMDGLAMGLHSVYHSRSVGTAIENAVNMLGDADSTGSIAGQMAGAFYGFSHSLLKTNSDNNNNSKGKKKKLVDETFLVEQITRWDDCNFGLRAVLLYVIGKANAKSVVQTTNTAEVK